MPSFTPPVGHPGLSFFLGQFSHRCNCSLTNPTNQLCASHPSDSTRVRAVLLYAAGLSAVLILRECGGVFLPYPPDESPRSSPGGFCHIRFPPTRKLRAGMRQVLQFDGRTERPSKEGAECAGVAGSGLLPLPPATAARRDKSRRDRRKVLAT